MTISNEPQLPTVDNDKARPSTSESYFDLSVDVPSMLEMAPLIMLTRDAPTRSFRSIISSHRRSILAHPRLSEVTDDDSTDENSQQIQQMRLSELIQEVLEGVLV